MILYNFHTHILISKPGPRRKRDEPYARLYKIRPIFRDFLAYNPREKETLYGLIF